MKTAGIIAEYNPFHNGHAYQLREIKKHTGADYVVIAMSGDYVQRGEPAILDKYTRTQMALENGADLVLELPVGIATASAEAFAHGGVELLAATGVIDYLGFGAETDDLPMLTELAHILNEEPEAYRTALRQALSDGQSFPAARAEAVAKYISGRPASEDASKTTAILSQPNNILAIEYLKALEQVNPSPITPILIPRIGDSYHTADARSDYASATAVRRLLYNQSGNRPVNTGSCLTALLPASCMELLNSYSFTSRFLCADDLSELLGYCLLLYRTEGYETFADVSSDLSSRIRRLKDHYQNFTQFAELLKTRELTFTRISRALLHIVLDIKKEDTVIGSHTVPYLRILGFRQDAAPLLHEIKKRTALPILSKMADAPSLLDDPAMRILNKEIFVSDLYQQLARYPDSISNAPNDINHGLIPV